MNGIERVVCFLPDWRAPIINKLGLLTRSAGLEFHACEDGSQVEKLLKESTPDKKSIFFTDTDHLDLVKRTSRGEDVRTVLLLTSKLQKVADQLTGIHNVHCMVANQDKDFDARDVLIMLKKFQQGDILGLDKYLGYGAEIRKETIRTDKEKKQAVQTMHDFVAGLGGADSGKFLEYGRRTSELVDELILNGVFNANPRFKGQDRDDPFELQENEGITIEFGFDGEYFGVSVRDPFGALSREKILSFLNETRVIDQVSARPSGGLGLKVIFDRLHRFVVNVHPGNVTEAICLLKFENRIRDFDKRLRSFYYFTGRLDQAS